MSRYCAHNVKDGNYCPECNYKFSIPIVRAQAIQEVIEVLRDEKIAPRMTSLDNPGYYLGSDDVANFLKDHFATDLTVLKNLEGKEE